MMRTLARPGEASGDPSTGQALLRAVIAIVGITILLVTAAAVLRPTVRRLVALTQATTMRLQARARVVE